MNRQPDHMDIHSGPKGHHDDVAPDDNDSSKEIPTVAVQETSGHAKDKALDLLQQAPHINIDEVDPKILKRIIWKIDLVIMPCMMFCEFFQFLDKSSIAYANLFGIQEATNLKGQDFAWLGSLFYIGYLAYQPIAAWLLVRVPVRAHLAGIVIAWGTILGCLAAGKNFSQLAALRFLLGMAESAMIPILGSITGMFYTRDEQATRVGIWFGAVGPSQIFGGLIAYGMFKLNSTTIAAWQFVFVVLGPITVVFGLYIACVMPANPATAWFLTSEERLIALERIRRNKTGTTNNQFKIAHVKEAIKDPRLYIAAVSVFCASVQNGGVSSFGATIIAGFGFDTKQTTLLGMCTGASEIAAFVVGVLLSRRLKMRIIPAMFCIFVAVIGAALMVGTHSRNSQYGGYLLIFWTPVGQLMFIPLMQSMVAGHTKRAVFYGLYQVGYSCGNIVGSQVYKKKDGPEYIPAKVTILVTITMHAVTMGIIGLIHKRWNDQRAMAVQPVEEEENIEFRDHTDKEIRSFVYPY